MYHSRFYAFDKPVIITDLGQEIESTLGIATNDKTIQGSYGRANQSSSEPMSICQIVLLKVLKNSMNSMFFLSLFTLVLCGTGFAFIIWSSIIQQLQHIGNLRYLGISIKSVRQFYLNIAFKMALIVTSIGILLGVIISQIVYTVVANISNLSATFIHITPIDCAYVIGFSLTIIIAITYLIIQLLNQPLNFIISMSNKNNHSLCIQLLGQQY